LAKERILKVLSPLADRHKLAPNEPPPQMPKMGGSLIGFDPTSVTLAKRLDTLENKTIYLVDIGFGGGNAFMQEIQRWFGEHIPSVKTVLRRKPGMVFADDNNELWEEVKAKGDAAIIGVAG
jgi:hypothetical protein